MSGTKEAAGEGSVDRGSGGGEIFRARGTPRDANTRTVLARWEGLERNASARHIVDAAGRADRVLVCRIGQQHSCAHNIARAAAALRHLVPADVQPLHDVQGWLQRHVREGVRRALAQPGPACLEPLTGPQICNSGTGDLN